MRRRGLVMLMASAAMWPALIRAQPANRLPRIGILGIESNTQAFREGLRDLGYVDGQNVVVEYPHLDGPSERLPELAAELVKRRVDVIFAAGSEATRAARSATATIPIVMTSANPVGAGFVTSLARPGGNITGFSLNDPGLSAKRMEILKEMVPGISKVAVFLNPDDPSVAFALKETQSAAQAMGMRLQAFEIRNGAAFDGAFLAAGKERVEGVIVLPAPLMRAHTDRIVGFAAKNRLPTIYFSPDAPRAGGLASYGVNLSAVYRRAAYYVDRILRVRGPAIFRSSSRRGSSW